MSQPPLRVAMIGYGTVGRGVAQLLKDMEDARRHDVDAAGSRGRAQSTWSHEVCTGTA